MLEGCELLGYPHNCGGPRLHLHHLVNYSKALGNAEVRAILKTNPPELTSWVCANANTARVADSKGAQAFLFEKKVREHGYDHIKRTLDDLPWKIPRPELTLEALLATPIDTADQ